MSLEPKVQHIRLPRHNLSRLAGIFISLAPHVKPVGITEKSIKVVCISDTHNSQPDLPPGDLLLHAGYLTEWGSFEEVQAQLKWLSSQPHAYKVLIAGNHDILFDPAFLESEKERFPVKEGQTRDELDFGSVVYLQDETATLDFPALGRSCVVFGSPWTPKYVKSAFQYSRDDDIWSRKIPKDVDVILTHGPPYGHLDGPRRSGCQYLAESIADRRPRLVVFGHIHAGHGRELLRYDALRRIYEDIESGWSGWEMIPLMVILLIWYRTKSLFESMFGLRKEDRLTELVNAAIVGKENRPCNAATVTYL